MQTSRAPSSPRNVGRTSAQRSQLLDALIEVFPAPLPYSRLKDVAGLRPGARVEELRRAGWAVERVVVDQASKVCTYRLASLEQGEELEVHAACSIYYDSSQGWHARVHGELSGRYSEGELAQAAEEAEKAFRAALLFPRKAAPSSSSFDDLGDW